jgi:hypothetical protein
MIQNLLPLFPRRIGGIGLIVVAGVLLFGLFLWLSGARFSRPLLALAATVSGGAVGYQFPKWFGLNLDPWTMVVLGSLILGTIGFMAHRFLAAMGLGVILAAWAALAIIACVGLGHAWNAPPPTAEFATFLNHLQKSLPPQLVTMILSASGIAIVAGTTTGFFWRRLGVVLFWSMTGLILVLLSALALTQSAGSQYVRAIAFRPERQALTIAVLLTIGAIVQWKMTFAKRSSKPAAPAPKPVPTA